MIKGPSSLSRLGTNINELETVPILWLSTAGMKADMPLVLSMFGETWQLERRLAMSVALGPRQCCVAATPTRDLSTLVLRPICLMPASLR